MSELKTGKYQSYPEYKDSGVECLGKVPEHWEVKKIKHFGRVIGGFAFKSGDFVKQGYPVIKITNVSHLKISYDDKSYLPENFAHDNAEYIAPLNSLVFAMTRPIISGGIKVAKMPRLEVMPLVNQRVGFIKIESEDLADYILFSSLSNSFITQFKNNMTITNQPNISGEGIESVLFPFPPEKELKKIVSFLDHETAKIDTLIEKQQQLIKLLKEKRQAVISHTVTKGLNPNVPMKDSDVEWLGEVPEHWVVTRAKYVSKIFVPQRNKPELNDSTGIAWATMEDMKQQYIYATSNFVSPESILSAGSKLLKKGAVIASCVGNFGVTSINKIDVIINQQLQAFQPVNIKAEYLQSIVTLSKQYFELIGTAATLVYVNQEGFENLPVLMPPEKEQNEISDYILEKNTSFDLLIDKSIIQTALLKERRTALISAAVTGKIDVRNWERPND